MTQAQGEGTVFQNVPAGGGSAGDARAILDVAYPYNGTVGLVDATTPLAVFNNGSLFARARRYDGSGPLNSVANWTQSVDLGFAAYPQLAGGPTGLIMMAESSENGMISARRWDGTTFGPAVPIARGDAPWTHLAQDAAGRLHAVFQQGTAGGLHLIHATSDDGANWQSGALLTHAEGFFDPRVATASDHVGVVVWQAHTATGPQIRVTALGPTAPVSPVAPVAPMAPVAPAPTAPADTRARPSFGLTRGRATRRGKKFRISMRGQIVHDAADAVACAGTVRITVRRGKNAIQDPPPGHSRALEGEEGEAAQGPARLQRERRAQAIRPQRVDPRRAMSRTAALCLLLRRNRFVIRSRSPRVEVSWQVTGIRKDAYAQRHRIPVEPRKPKAERGRYLQPGLFGKPARVSIGAASSRISGSTPRGTARRSDTGHGPAS